MPDAEIIRQVALRISEVRERAGFTQEQVAETLGMAAKNYQRIERGQNLTITTLARVAEALGVAPLELWRKPRKQEKKAGRPRRKTRPRRRS